MPSAKNQESTYVGDEVSDWLQDSADELGQSKSALLGRLLEKAKDSTDGEVISKWGFEIEVRNYKPEFAGDNGENDGE